MRGEDERGGGLFSYVDLEARVPADHPLRPIRVLVDEALAALSADFERLYSRTGRPSIAPEKLLRALLLQAFYTIRSERQLMEQLDYNLLFRWFVGLSMDAPVWDATVYSKNRDRLVAGDVAARFLQAVLRGARVRRLLSDEHFSVDGTLVEAWASMKSFRRKDGGGGDPPAGRNAERDFRGERRSNATHASATDGDARLFRKGDGQSSRLCFMGHLLMENANALIVDAALTRASGTAEGESDMRLPDAARAEQDYILPAVDVIAAREIQHQHLVEAGDRLEVEAFELFDDGEAGLPDAALDQAALAIDHLHLHQPGEELHMIQPLGRALARQFLVLAQEGRQLQPLQVMFEQDAGGLSHGRPLRPAERRNRRSAWRRRRAGAGADNAPGRDARAASRCAPATGA